ncbi:MAG TPA: hypothetical protein VGD10_03115 [Allosphingosinicella sp.]|uniref:hypothetical protein n=1 Tax=Allosphingosinicella sp. TaxID=2823234 RepID=UPI002ED978D0
MKHRSILIATAAAVSLAGCSAKPRSFVPTLAAAPSDQAKYDAEYQACETMVAAGKRSGFKDSLASAGTGVVAGVGAGAVTGAAMAGTYATYAGAAAAASAVIVAVPVVGIAAAWGLSKSKKAKREKEAKAAMSQCLSEHGYSVASWDVAKKKRKAKPAAAPVS